MDNNNNKEGLQEKLYECIKNADIDGVKLCVRNGCHVNEKKNGETPLHIAIDIHDDKNKNTNEIVDYLIRRGADVNRRIKPLGYSSLHLACSKNNYNALKLLIKDLHRRNYSLETHITSMGDTCLIIAASNNSIECMELLLKKKACVSTVGSDGRTAIEWAAKNRRYEAVRLLVKHHADIFRAPDNHESVIVKAKKSKILQQAINDGLKDRDNGNIEGS